MNPKDIDRIAKEEQQARGRAKNSKKQREEAAEERLQRKIDAVQDTPSRVVFSQGEGGSELIVQPNPILQTFVARGFSFVGLIYAMLIMPLVMLGYFLALQLGIPFYLGVLLTCLLMAVLDYVSLWWMFPPVTLRITKEGNFAILRKRIFRSSNNPDFIGVKAKLLVYLTDEREHSTLALVPGWWELNIKPGVKPQFTASGFVYRFTDRIMTPDKNNEFLVPWYPYLLNPADAERVRGFCEEWGIEVKHR